MKSRPWNIRPGSGVNPQVRLHTIVLAPAALGARSMWAQPRAAGYEASSIRPNRNGDLIFRKTPAGNRFVASDVSLFTLIQWAYKLQQSRISGAAAWTRSERFDIEATAPRVNKRPAPHYAATLAGRPVPPGNPMGNATDASLLTQRHKGNFETEEATCTGIPSFENPCGTFGESLGND